MFKNKKLRAEYAIAPRIRTAAFYNISKLKSRLIIKKNYAKNLLKSMLSNTCIYFRSIPDLELNCNKTFIVAALNLIFGSILYQI